MSETRIVEATVDQLSIDFDDYTPQARMKYEGTHMFLGVHVPLDCAKSLPIGSTVRVVMEVAP